MRATRSPVSWKNLWTLARGRVPGQVIVQLTDKCNARCPQCEMRVQNPMPRTTLDVEVVKRTIDAAAKRGVQAISFTGGEPLMVRDQLLSLIRHATAAGIPLIRTGTNGFTFTGADKPNFETKVRKFAEELASTGIYTFWISIDSVVDQVHETMRGLPGVIRGIAKAVPILHEFGIYPSANLGINRNLAGDDTPLHHSANGSNGSGESKTAVVYDVFRDGFSRFYRKVADFGFTIVNMCYPMSVERGAEPGLEAVYAASSTDAIVRFSRDEKLGLFRALADTVPEHRSRIRIFTPLSSVRAILQQYEDSQKVARGCRGGLDFFFVSATDGHAYPCGYRGQEDLGPYENIDLSRANAENCTRCDWECFRDPSELAGPAMDLFARPTDAARFLMNAEARRIWWSDLKYYRACDYFCGRRPPDYARMAKDAACTA